MPPAPDGEPTVIDDVDDWGEDFDNEDEAKAT